MKFLTSILVFLFVLFQFSKSIICFIEKSNNISLEYNTQNQDEEEDSKEDKDNKELKSEFTNVKTLKISFLSYKKLFEINKIYLFADYNVDKTITILPPDKV
jgi:hypothetical protein